MSLQKWFVLSTLVVMFVGCSSNEEEIVQDDQENVELSEADEELDGSEVVLDEDLLEEKNSGDAMTAESSDDSMIVITEDGQEKVIQNDNSSPLEVPSSSVSKVSHSHMNTPVKLDNSKGYASYKVQKGDTLMWVAFKIYGDYTKWRHLAHANSDMLKGGQTVASGMTLKYVPPVQEFDWSPSGNPYLVKKGDTLGTISKDVYGVTKRWREIFEFNRPLIRDPNLIFAGFTVYYQPDGKKLAGKPEK